MKRILKMLSALNQTGITAVITDSKAYSKVRYYNEKNHGDVAEIEVYGKKLKQ